MCTRIGSKICMPWTVLKCMHSFLGIVSFFFSSLLFLNSSSECKCIYFVHPETLPFTVMKTWRNACTLCENCSVLVFCGLNFSFNVLILARMTRFMCVCFYFLLFSFIISNCVERLWCFLRWIYVSWFETLGRGPKYAHNATQTNFYD